MCAKMARPKMAVSASLLSRRSCSGAVQPLLEHLTPAFAAKARAMDVVPSLLILLRGGRPARSRARWWWRGGAIARDRVADYA